MAITGHHSLLSHSVSVPKGHSGVPRAALGTGAAPCPSHRCVSCAVTAITEHQAVLLAPVPHSVCPQGVTVGCPGQLRVPAVDGIGAAMAAERPQPPQGAGSQAERPIIHQPKEQ